MFLSKLVYKRQLRHPLMSAGFSTVTYSLPRCAASVLVESDDAVIKQPVYLLIKRAKAPAAGKWALPGGRIMLGETIVDAGLRELSEEASLKKEDVKLISDTSISTDAIYYSRDSKRSVDFHFVVSTIVVSLPGEKKNQAVAADDATECNWFTIDQIEQLKTANQVAGDIQTLIKKFRLLAKI